MKSKLYSIILGTVLLLAPYVSLAQGVSLAITPTLFEMSAVPYQVWNSSIKVINNNKQPLTVYTDVVNFAPQGELGQGKFLPVLEEVTGGQTLAEWITVPDEPIVIPPESSQAVPISVRIPGDAAPGGHYAAILIGTKPPENDKPFRISTSQVISSLFFVRVAGDVIEDGKVRSFSVTDRFLDTPEATFVLRFENKGNVHLLPQGEIVITNMWGKERGIIPINNETNFGNVLPESIRKFEFTWKGEQSFTDIGRYKAVLTLGYGLENKKFVTRETYFYVVPIKQVVTVLLVFIGIIWFISWAIKAYVRRMLALSGIEAQGVRSRGVSNRYVLHKGDVFIDRRASLQRPIVQGIKDFREHLYNTHAFVDVVKSLLAFLWQYKKFFAGVLGAVALVFLLFYYTADVLTDRRDYEVTIENPDTDITLSSEEILYKKQQQESIIRSTTTVPQREQSYELVLVNSSDTPGVAAALQVELEGKGYRVDALESDFGPSRKSTVIIFDAAVQEEALSLSKELGGVLLNARPESMSASSTPNITVLIGNTQ